MKIPTWCGRNLSNGFTLIELMLTVAIIGLIASFGIPSYQKAVRKTKERNAILHLRTIHGANEIYRARVGEYAPGAGIDLAGINVALSINIIDAEMTYLYTRTTPTQYVLQANWAGANPFTLEIDESPITASRPCCEMGPCLVAPDC